MEELASKQNQTGAEIQKIITNFKKDPSIRKDLPYLQERLRRLDEAWDTFETTDNTIRIQHADQLNHPYFAKDYYEGISKVYHTYRDQIQNMMECVQSTSNQPIDPKETRKENQHQLIASNTAPISDEGESMSEHQVKVKEAKTLKGRNINIPEEVTKLTRKQKIIIESLRRLVEGINRDNRQRPKQYYELKIQTINHYWSQIENHHHTIYELIEDPIGTGYDCEEYYQIQEEVEEISIRLAQELERCTSSTQNAAPSTQLNSEVQVKLPKITLPTFDGNYFKWTQFHDLYVQLIHNQPISKAQKMFYLTTNVTGEARGLIRHLPVSDDNYDAAWNLLKNRYENKRLLVNALLNKFLSQPVIQIETAAAIKSLHDTTNECLLGLKNLGLSIDSWDPLLVYLLIKRFDKNTHALYEQSLDSPRELSSVKQLLEFLEIRFQALESLGRDKRNAVPEKSTNKYHNHTRSSFVTTIQATQCVVCKQGHPLYSCKEFLALTPINRYQTLKKHKFCLNCMREGHSAKACTLRGCVKCSRKHNTLIHVDDFAEVQTTKANPARGTVAISSTIEKPANHHRTTQFFQENQQSTTEKNQSVTLSAQMTQAQRSYVLLSTVIIKLTNNEGTTVECRAILDSGSQLNFITERVAKKLGLNEIPGLMYIHGIGQSKQQTQRRASVLVQSITTGFSTRLEAFILPQITSNQPTLEFKTTAWPIPQNIKLADPKFNRPDCIDVLIGAEIFYELLTVGQIKLGDNLPTLQNTVFGWVLAGKVKDVRQPQAICGICSDDESFDQQIERFWRLEEGEKLGTGLTPTERKCETHFNQTTKRDSEGHFVVSLPFMDSPEKLGRSEDIAIQRFLALERKFAKHEELRLQYVEFMKEYINLGHMEEIDFNLIQKPYYFLPHHYVLKPDSSTTKLRVVFDASAKTSSNISLNDILHTGPTIQNDLFSVLLRFRMPRFVFTADIEKMYRQVKVQAHDRKYQLIVWRNDPSEAVKCYQLNTVTYGTASAPYLAIKCLHKLSEDEQRRYPLGSEVLKRDFYVDDVMTGSDSLNTASEVQSQLKLLLQTAGFKLRKWCANHPRLLQNLPTQDLEVKLDFDNKMEEHIKTLGLTWLPKADSFCVKTSWTEGRRVTKRTICSDIAHLFDPLGIMAPVVITAKMFLQRLWILKLDWDASLPQELHTSWVNFRSGLRSLNNIRIPRRIFSHHISKSFQLHAFADASEKAYGAAIYIRSVNEDQTITVRLLCAKSRVAPTKQTTLPRLELCAAKLAAELATRVKSNLALQNEVTFFWTDSEIVLSWLNSLSSSFQTFVANRVAAIQELTIPNQWRHVGSKENPADILSRGIAPERLETCNLWFYGPLFLHGSEVKWPASYVPKIDCELEKRRIRTSLAVTGKLFDFVEHIDHKNSFKKLKRIVAYALRFIRHSRYKNSRVSSKSFTSHELNEALIIIIKKMQETEFKEDIANLARYGEPDKGSSISSLTPFLDERGIIRVGGRLEASDLPYDAKHPMLLPYSHPFTKLLMTDIHMTNCHTGPQTLLAITRQNFWPLKGKTIARSIVQHCVRCARAKPKLLSQLMGNLPVTRVQPARPFVNSGVDFCGPIWTHYKIRGKRPQKTYIAVFCCFATKATHLEVVSDLTTDGFIGALKRFMGRRGHCKNLYCDNATNFVGAKNQLEELNQIIKADSSIEKITTICSAKGIDFRLIPPRAPHFGGLWEAAVKSAKHLLQRTVASASLTYEELETVIVEIEGILNSRPLTPMSSDPNDFTALTPGHLLIGEPLTSSIHPDSQPVKASLLTRWKLVSHLKNEFWRRWSNEYLNELQHRYKWKTRCENVQPGTMVIIKDDNLPALKWPLGRIVKTIKGNDNLVRVADVQTSTGVLRRPIHKLSPLPIDEDEQCSQDATSRSHKDTELNSLHNDKDSPLGDRNNEQISPNEITDGIPRKRIRNSYSSAIATLLLTCLILPAIKCSPIEVIPFKSQPGIYFEAMGSTHLVSNEWSLVVFYNMTTYWKEFDTLNFGINRLRNICSRMKGKEQCEQTVAQFSESLSDIRNNNQLLLHRTHQRGKRAPLNIVGNLANSLFGVLDSEYAEKMSQVIENLKGNDQQLLELIKNQTSIIDSTTNVMQRSQEAVENQLKGMDSYINATISQINNISQDLHEQRAVETFNSLSVRLILMITNYQRMQATFLDVIIDTHHGKINPQLLSPSQLQTELNLIKEHLPSTLRLPAKQHNLLETYSFLTIEGRVAPEQIIFRLKLPLFSYEEFELLRIIPVPVLINDTFLAVRPSSKFLIINLHRDQYYPLSEQELSTCTTIISDSSYMCKQHHPLYRQGSNISSCELSFITHTSSSGCKLEAINEPVKWIQLLNPNHWIYIMPKANPVNIVCGNSVSQKVFNGSGIVKLTNNCIIKDETTTIQAHHLFPSTLRTSFIPSKNLSDLMQLSKVSEIIYHPIAHQNITNNIRELQEKIKLLQKEEVLPNDHQPHYVHHLTVGYSSLIIAVIVLFYIIWKWNRERRPRAAPKPPVPMPRTTSMSNVNNFSIQAEL